MLEINRCRQAGMSRPALHGGKSMKGMPFLLVLRLKVWRRRVLYVVVNLNRA
jgi:hypothetical protein